MLRYYHKESPKYRKAFRGFFFANSPILDYNLSRFLLTNSLKSLPFSKFFEIKAKLCYPKMSEWVPVSIITKTSLCIQSHTSFQALFDKVVSVFCLVGLSSTIFCNSLVDRSFFRFRFFLFGHDSTEGDEEFDEFLHRSASSVIL